MTERDARPTGLKHANMAMTPERKDKYLEVLAATGSSVAAAAQASPEAYGARPGYTSFYNEKKKDPEFAVRCEEAMDSFLGVLEANVVKWATTPTRRPVVANGEIVGFEEKPPDPRLVLATLRRYNPRWNEKQTLEHTGNVDHTHRGGLVMASISADDVMLLPQEKRATFAALLTDLLEAKQAQTTAIEHQSE